MIDPMLVLFFVSLGILVLYIVLRTGTQAVLRTYYTEQRNHWLECRRLHLEGEKHGQD